MGYSPVLGIATALFELLACAWVLRVSRGLPQRRAILYPIAALLALLAGYQIFEVLICTGAEERRPVLSRMAFLDITWLPPLSVLLISRILPDRARIRKFARLTLSLGAVFSFWIIVDTRFITGTICQFMTAGYSYVEPYFHFYGAFYEITQMSIIFMPAALLAGVDDRFTRAHLSDLLLGALLYILPSLFLGAARPQDFDMALPSLMCHFAVFFALFLIRIVRREQSRHLRLNVA